MNDAPKSIEIELKLILPNGRAEVAVADFLRQNNYTVDKIEPLTNVDIYMDTSDWALKKNKLSLRYRLSNNKPMYTLKSISTIEDGIAKRMETEITLKEPPHTPIDIPVKKLRKQVKDIIYPRKLMEQILIRTSRRRYAVVSPEGAKFELAFDTSSFSADPLGEPKRAPRLYELEAEVIKGSDTALKSLATLLSDKFGYLPSIASKLESAMMRLKVEPLIKKVTEDMVVGLDDRLDLALKKILTTEFRWLHQQIPGVLSDRDPEFVHQARVATRRMRSALILFHNALPERTVIYFEERLKWLGGLFGAVRDLDVFIINLTSYKDKLSSFPKEKRQTLESLVVERRRAPLIALNEALNSRRYHYFERRLTRFLEEPSSASSGSRMGMKPIREVAPQAITQRFENVIAQSRKTLANPKLNEFHCLRIQMKRLRYTVEFMAPPYGAAFDDLIQRSVAVQDCLGELQDTVSHQKLIKTILADWQGKLVDPELIFILGEIYQLQGHIAQERQQTFNAIWARFTEASLQEQMTTIPAGV